MNTGSLDSASQFSAGYRGMPRVCVCWMPGVCPVYMYMLDIFVFAGVRGMPRVCVASGFRAMPRVCVFAGSRGMPRVLVLLDSGYAPCTCIL